MTKTATINQAAPPKRTVNVAGEMRCTNCRENVHPEKFGAKRVCPNCLTDALIDLDEWKRQQKARWKSTRRKKVKRVRVQIGTSPAQLQRRLYAEADEFFNVANL